MLKKKKTKYENYNDYNLQKKVLLRNSVKNLVHIIKMRFNNINNINNLSDIDDDEILEHIGSINNLQIKIILK